MINKKYLAFLLPLLVSCGGNQCPLVPTKKITFPFKAENVISMTYEISGSESFNGETSDLNTINTILQDISTYRMQIRVNKNYNPDSEVYTHITSYVFYLKDVEYDTYAFVSKRNNVITDYIINGECHRNCSPGYFAEKQIFEK